MMANDLSQASFDVVSDVGPSSSSKRAATVRALTGMMQITQDPETLQVLGAMAMMNMEGEGVEDVRDFFRQRLIRMGVVQPTEKEAQAMMAEMQGQQPDPQAMLMQAMSEEAIAKAAKARADTVKVVADAELSRARTVETLANVDMDTQDHAIDLARSIGSAVAQQAQSPMQ
jgi:hypothetical protein